MQWDKSIIVNRKEYVLLCEENQVQTRNTRGGERNTNSKAREV